MAGGRAAGGEGIYATGVHTWQGVTSEQLVTGSHDPEATETSEVLLVLSDAAGEQGLDQLSADFRVVSALPPRLVVVKAAESTLVELRRNPVVRFVATDTVGEEILDGLTADERVFATAWELRRRASPKTRLGEGLPWDAPGFLPPDPPPGVTEH